MFPLVQLDLHPLPFCLKNAPTFNNALNNALIVFIDNLILFTKIFDDFASVEALMGLIKSSPNVVQGVP